MWERFSVHAQLPRHIECCAVLGRNSSNGETANPRERLCTAAPIGAQEHLRHWCRTLRRLQLLLLLWARRRRRCSGWSAMPEYRFGDRIRQRLGFLEQAQYRQDHKEECEIVDGENARGDDIATRRLACPEIAEPDHSSKENKQKLPVQRPIVG